MNHTRMLAFIIVLQLFTLSMFFALPSLQFNAQGEEIGLDSQTDQTDISGRLSQSTPNPTMSVTQTQVPASLPVSQPLTLTSLVPSQIKQVFQCSQVLPEYCSLYAPYCKQSSGNCIRDLETAPVASSKPTVYFGNNPSKTPASSTIREGATCTDCINISFQSILLNPASVKFTCTGAAASGGDVRFFYKNTEVFCNQAFSVAAGSPSVLLSTQAVSDTLCKTQDETITLTLDCGVNSVSCIKGTPAAHTVKIMDTSSSCPPALTFSVVQTSAQNTLNWNARYATECTLGTKLSRTGALWKYSQFIPLTGSLGIPLLYSDVYAVMNCSNSNGYQAKELVIPAVFLPTPSCSFDSQSTY